MLFFFYTYRYVGLLYVGTSSTYVYAPLSLSLSHLRRPLLFDFIFFNSFLFFFFFFRPTIHGVYCVPCVPGALTRCVRRFSLSLRLPHMGRLSFSQQPSGKALHTHTILKKGKKKERKREQREYGIAPDSRWKKKKQKKKLP